MKIPTDMISGSTYNTNQCGELVVIDYIKASSVKVKFIKTGFITTTQVGNVRRGCVKDRSHIESEIGLVYNTNSCGRLKILNIKTVSDVKVEFLSTGCITNTTLSNIKNGNVKDYLKPMICGVGFIGQGMYKTGKKSKAFIVWTKWRGMLVRCYDEEYQSKNKTYIGCSVCEEWHNFQNFAKWFYINYKSDLHLDKDIKVKGNKIYSPETCMFVTGAENTIEAKAKRYKFISPEGIVVDIYNMSEFCRVNGLSQGHMASVNTGNRNKHKGWTRYED